MPPKILKNNSGDGQSEERLTRIAVISADRCRPKKCKQECKKSCPVVKCGAYGRRLSRLRLLLSASPASLPALPSRPHRPHPRRQAVY